MLSFLLTILAGSILLHLPISSADGRSIPYIDALFTATTATCVTGLVTVTTATAWSIFGQAVILLLIQIGGLGIITVVSGVMVAFHKKMGLRDSQLIQDAFNLNTLAGLSKFIKKVIIGTLIIEAAGALAYMTVIVPQYGARGIWISAFNSVSAFCNAGMDIIGEVSLCEYATNPIVNGVTEALIILGGIGYIVWWDVIRVMKDFGKLRFASFKRLTLHSKIVLSTTAVLILTGAGLIFAFEYSNPETIGNMSLFDKIQISLFQSVTTRTAGFTTIPQENLTNASAMTSMLLMFIGGSPVGTAGGIKTATAAVLLATMICTVKNKNQITLYNRSLSYGVVRKAAAVTFTSFIILFISSVALSCATDASMIDVIYESVSATATVGLSRNLTASLGTLGRIIIITTMYFGRIGPITLAVAFSSKREAENSIKCPTEDISVG